VPSGTPYDGSWLLAWAQQLLSHTSVTPNTPDVSIAQEFLSACTSTRQALLNGKDSPGRRWSTPTRSTTTRRLDWVTDTSIDPRLAGALACLARDYDLKPIVIAHSMGGLATKYAAAQNARAPPARAASRIWPAARSAIG
jgi:hypothetical protein